MYQLKTKADLAAELAASQREVEDLRNALEAAAAVHMRDASLWQKLQSQHKSKAGHDAGAEWLQEAGGISAADKRAIMAAEPAYSGQMAASASEALPYPTDDAMQCEGGGGRSERGCGTGSMGSGTASMSAAAQGGRQAGALQGGQARTAWAIPVQQRQPGDGGGGGAAAELSWKEKYLALFTRTLQLDFKATAWRNEHARMQRALQAEVGRDADLEAVLAASGGDVNAAAAPWRGRAATIGLLRDQLRLAQAAASPPASPPGSSAARLSRRGPLLPSATQNCRAEADALRAELAAANKAVKEARAAALRAASRRAILEGEMKAARGHLAVLLRKADNDDRLIAALQAALKQQGGSSGAADAAAAAALSGAAKSAAEPTAVSADLDETGGDGSNWQAPDVLRIGSISDADRRAPVGAKTSEGSRPGTSTATAPQAPYITRSESDCSTPATAVAAAAAADVQASANDVPDTAAAAAQPAEAASQDVPEDKALSTAAAECLAESGVSAITTAAVAAVTQSAPEEAAALEPQVVDAEQQPPACPQADALLTASLNASAGNMQPSDHPPEFDSMAEAAAEPEHGVAAVAGKTQQMAAGAAEGGPSSTQADMTSSSDADEPHDLDTSASHDAATTPIELAGAAPEASAGVAAGDGNAAADAAAGSSGSGSLEADTHNAQRRDSSSALGDSDLEPAAAASAEVDIAALEAVAVAQDGTDATSSQADGMPSAADVTMQQADAVLIPTGDTVQGGETSSDADVALLAEARLKPEDAIAAPEPAFAMAEPETLAEEGASAAAEQAPVTLQHAHAELASEAANLTEGADAAGSTDIAAADDVATSEQSQSAPGDTAYLLASTQPAAVAVDELPPVAGAGEFAAAGLAGDMDAALTAAAMAAELDSALGATHTILDDSQQGQGSDIGESHGVAAGIGEAEQRGGNAAADDASNLASSSKLEGVVEQKSSAAFEIVDQAAPVSADAMDADAADMDADNEQDAVSNDNGQQGHFVTTMIAAFGGGSTDDAGAGSTAEEVQPSVEAVS